MNCVENFIPILHKDMFFFLLFSSLWSYC